MRECSKALWTTVKLIIACDLVIRNAGVSSVVLRCETRKRALSIDDCPRPLQSMVAVQETGISTRVPM